MLGVILCGGQSLRMGSDKGLLLSEGKIWAKVMEEKLSQISIPSVMSINSGQMENYLKYFKEKNLIIDNPAITIQGPLLGLLSVHTKHPDQDLLVLACDMIGMSAVVLEKMLSTYSTINATAIAYKGERVEPLCTIYSSAGLAKIYSAYRENKLNKSSLMFVLEELKAEFISIPENWKPFFKNFNSMKDLDA